MKRKKAWLIIGLIFCMYVVVLRPIIADSDAQMNSSAATTATQRNTSTDEERNIADESNRLVYMTGAVESPGLYEVMEGATIGDVIQMSGGFLPYAGVESLNLAEPLVLGSHIHVNFKFNGNPEVLLQKKKVNINTADEKGLVTLSGVGPGTAKKILDYREQHGPFKSIEDLKQVKGIGEATFKKLAPHITI